MHAAALNRDALMPRRPERLGPGLMLALLVHVGLVIGIAFGVSWRSHPPEAMEAELWAAVPQAAAPRAVEPEPQPAPAPAPAPTPMPEPKVTPPKVEAPPPPLPDAQIAIEKARLEAEKEKERQAEEAAREREELRKKQAAEKAAADKLAAEKREADRLAAEKLAAEKREAQEKKAEEARVAAQREENLKRILGQAGASGDARATGTAQQSSGPSASYAGRIRARVKPNIVFSDDLPGNPVAEVEVRLAPDGTILGTPRLLKSSGVAAWDEAVVRAIVKTEILPRDVDGRVFSPMVILFRARD